ncbi:DUF4126 domain-containing protein [Flavisphingomonas formosensis]|uniref:DUF4126 domain-containing protein n=1 Tax=Flavisphingomonas formosensis TaxID=861534 RepID=UPI0012F75D21|nr:DUF4126 domain-containing protein [Sphingomonas formosensis]
MDTLLAFLIGLVAGSRAIMAPAAISWAAATGRIDLAGTWLAFLGYRWTPWILTLGALGELVTDQLPTTPSRKVPVQFSARILTGALSGAAIGIGAGSAAIGLIAGAVGAIVGTLLFSSLRAKLAARSGTDRPAALIEDAAAIAGAALIVFAL